jgi:hypothetical protein
LGSAFRCRAEEAVVLGGDLLAAMEKDAHIVQVFETAFGTCRKGMTGADGETEGLLVEEPGAELGRRALVYEGKVRVALAQHTQLVGAAGVGGDEFGLGRRLAEEG